MGRRVRRRVLFQSPFATLRYSSTALGRILGYSADPPLLLQGLSGLRVGVRLDRNAAQYFEK